MRQQWSNKLAEVVSQKDCEHSILNNAARNIDRTVRGGLNHCNVTKQKLTNHYTGL